LKDVHAKSLALANRVVGEVSADFFDDPLWLPHIPKAVLQESALLNLINAVMAENSGADVSMSAVFDENSNLKAGPFHYKDACRIYRYDNTLMAVKVTGAQLKNIMERFSGSFFNAPKPGDVTISFNPNMRLYEYDAFYGLNYVIDISRPIGKRIVSVVYKGKPLAVDDELVLACNNYRYGQMVQEKLINADDVVYDSADSGDNSTIRDMIAAYIAKAKQISPQLYGSWRIVGYDYSDPQASLVWQMVREGRLAVPCSDNGRAVNSRSLNAEELRQQHILPPLNK
ncbi:5'-nucleotidase C-terminal domain-containing protein, partial [bacterium]|nr:5'-nucleotidase C-terminal domain-containing protein [bacterium]